MDKNDLLHVPVGSIPDKEPPAPIWWHQSWSGLGEEKNPYPYCESNVGSPERSLATKTTEQVPKLRKRFRLLFRIHNSTSESHKFNVNVNSQELTLEPEPRSLIHFICSEVQGSW
jgi:hypothetical protein